MRTLGMHITDQMTRKLEFPFGEKVSMDVTAYSVKLNFSSSFGKANGESY